MAKKKQKKTGKKTKQKKPKRQKKRRPWAYLLLAILLTGIVFFLYLLQAEPDFWSDQRVPPEHINRLMARVENKAKKLVNGLDPQRSFKLILREDEINAVITDRLPYSVVPEGFGKPQIKFEEGEVLVAAQYQSVLFPVILTVRVKPKTSVYGHVGFEVLGLKAGKISIPLAFLRKHIELVESTNIDPSLDYPLKIPFIPIVIHTFSLKAHVDEIQVRPKEMHIKGRGR